MRLAPASSFSRASAALAIPPTPMIVTPAGSARRSVATTAVARAFSGAPERPPCSRLAGRCATPSRATVVLVAITASMPRAVTRSAIVSIPASSTSGAIFTAKGTRFPYCFASRSRSEVRATSSASRLSVPCSERRSFVLGEEMFAVTKLACAYTLRRRHHRPDLDEAEAERRKSVDVLAVLVQARGEPHRIREIQPHDPHRHARRGGSDKRRSAEPRQDIEGFETEAVCRFRVECEKERTYGAIKHAAILTRGSAVPGSGADFVRVQPAPGAVDESLD